MTIVNVDGQQYINSGGSYYFGPTISNTMNLHTSNIIEVLQIHHASGGGASGRTCTMPGWTLIGRHEQALSTYNFTSGGPPDYLTKEFWWRWGAGPYSGTIAGTTTADRFIFRVDSYSGVYAGPNPVCSGVAWASNDPPTAITPLTLTVTSTAIGTALASLSLSIAAPSLAAATVGSNSHTFTAPISGTSPYHEALFVLREGPDLRRGIHRGRVVAGGVSR